MRIPLLHIAMLSACIAGMAASNEKQLATLSDFFNPERLVQIEITMDAEDWDKLCRQTRQFMEALGQERRTSTPPTPFTYFPAQIRVDGVSFEKVGVRKKGFIGSLDEVRPSLKIRFNKYDKHQRFSGMDRLTLNNNKQDPSVISQYLAYRTFNQSGVPAPRCNFARVTVNGNNLGVYSNVESVRPEFLATQFEDGTGNLYEGTVTDFFEEWADSLERKTNKTDASREHLLALVQALKKDDDQLQSALERVVNLDQFYRYWAVESLIAFWDGYSGNQNNYFIYLDPKDQRFNFIPWGADSVFSKRRRMRQGGPESVQTRGLLADRLYGLSTGKKAYREALLDILENSWKEADLLQEIDRMEQQLEGKLHGNQQGFKRALNGARAFVTNRREEIMEEMKDGPVEPGPGATEPMYFEEMGVLSATFDTTYNEDASGEDLEGAMHLTMDGKSVALKEVEISSGPARWPPGNDDANITLQAKRESDNMVLRFFVGIAPDLFAPTKGNTVKVGGMMMPGRIGGRAGMKMLSGTANLDKAGMATGDMVKGVVEMKILKMTNSPFGRR